MHQSRIRTFLYSFQLRHLKNNYVFPLAPNNLGSTWQWPAGLLMQIFEPLPSQLQAPWSVPT